MTATHPDAGALDATLPDLGADLAWEVVHKPPSPIGLVCRGCEHTVHAKVSPRGLRFFAHNSEQSDCPLNGESPDHRLLKSELAAALRAAGWTADLEVPGNGWRADVLGTSPDGQRRIAWEAQLAYSSIEDLQERTRRMAVDQVEVCWVSDKDALWLRHVPSVRVARHEVSGSLTVTDGASTFSGSLCPDPSRCHEFPVKAPCPGHGAWTPPNTLTLESFVAAVCADRVRPVRMRLSWQHTAAPASDGRTVWTAKAHLETEQRHVEARERHEVWADREEEGARAHERAIEALIDRQQKLIPLTVSFAKRSTGQPARAYDEDRDPDWAMGVPVFAGGDAFAVICPVASRVSADKAVRDRLAGLLVVIASRSEQDRLAKVCAPGQRFKLFEPRERGALPSLSKPPAHYGTGSISVGQAVSRMFGGY